MGSIPGENIQIRKATLADAADILRCLAEAFQPYREQYTPAGFADTVLSPQTIEARLREMQLYVAVSSSGEIIGTIGGSANGAEGHIRGMAVRQAWQGCGAAAALLQAIEEDLWQRRCRFITLDTTAPLRRAIRFYEKHGYRATGKVASFFGMELFEFEKQAKEGRTVDVVNLEQKFSLFSEPWSPKIIGEVNDSYVKAVKFRGEFVWHHHDNEDELFLVTRGMLRMKFRDREEVIRPGEFIIVPRGVEHLPVADEETYVILLEPKSTLNTGNVKNERTREVLDRL